MAIFKIKKIIVNSATISEIYIAEIYKFLSINDEFKTFDTHHPINWKIINRSGIRETVLTCSTNYQSKIYVEMFVGAIIDTEKNSQRFYEYDLLNEYKNSGWKTVPDEYFNQWNLIFNEVVSGFYLSKKCTICNKLGLKRYFNTHKAQQFSIDGIRYLGKGSLWEWCSCCMHYEHSSTNIPEWWPYENIIEEKNLMHNPENIDNILSGKSD